MPFQRLPRVPSKLGLTWRIARLCLDDGGTSWSATAVKGGRVATVRLPPLLETTTEEAWLASIEAALDANARDPIEEDTPASAALGIAGINRRNLA